MTTEFDFTQEEAWEAGAPILGVGRHTCRITNPGESETSNKNPQIELKLVSLAGNGDIRDWVVITPNTMGKVLQLAEAAGVAPPGKVSIPSPEWSAWVKTLDGRDVSIWVGEEESFKDPAKMRNVVTSYMPVSGSDVPANTAGLGANGGAQKADNDIPF